MTPNRQLSEIEECVRPVGGCPAHLVPACTLPRFSTGRAMVGVRASLQVMRLTWVVYEAVRVKQLGKKEGRT